MERSEALKLLASKNADDRLRAARVLAREGVETDVPTLKEFFAKETHRWVKSALRKAVSSLADTNDSSIVEVGADGEDERTIEQIHAEAVEETTLRFVHEIRPIIGRLNVYAAKEFSGYGSSRTKAEWVRLQELLTALDKLGQTAASPVMGEFDLAELVESTVSSETEGKATVVEIAGQKPSVMVGSRSLVQIILSNALRNAIEATEGLSTPESIVVTWGTTDIDHWLAVLDRGRGLPSGANKVWEIGSTTKRGHLGMGLALARQAALTLNGKISLAPREPSGAVLEFRWPHVAL